MPDWVFFVRQRHRHLVVAVIDRPDHQRAVGIAVLIGDEHLVAYARTEPGATRLPGPELRHAHAPRYDLLAVPIELEKNAAVLVDVDLLALVALVRAHERRLNACDRRAPRRQQRTKLPARIHHLVSSRIGGRRGGAGDIGLIDIRMRAAQNHIFLVVAGDGILAMRELVAGRERRDGPDADAMIVERLHGLDAHFRILLGVRLPEKKGS